MEEKNKTNKDSILYLTEKIGSIRSLISELLLKEEDHSREICICNKELSILADTIYSLLKDKEYLKEEIKNGKIKEIKECISSLGLRVDYSCLILCLLEENNKNYDLIISLFQKEDRKKRLPFFLENADILSPFLDDIEFRDYFYQLYTSEYFEEEDYSDSFIFLLEKLSLEQLSSVLKESEFLLGYLKVQEMLEKKDQDLEKENIVFATSEELQTRLAYLFFKTTFEDFENILTIILTSDYIDQLSKEERKFIHMIDDTLTQSIEFYYQMYQYLKTLENPSATLYDIVSKLRFLSTNDITKHIFHLGEEPSNEPKNYFIRSNTSPNPFLSKGEPVKCASFSIINEDNLSTYLYNNRIIYGFSNVNPDTIIHIYPTDSLSSNRDTHPYEVSELLPFYISLNLLNQMTKKNETYNEIVVLNEDNTLKPDYILAIDSIRRKDKKASLETCLPIIKVKSKKSSIMNHEDYINYLNHD